jgi:GH25 family lysozyme M1 (1,4-beta-N-acetylmuramidase)
MLYGTKEWLLEKYQLATLTSTDIWLAQYETKPDYPYAFTMWQYTQDGTVPGISGKVDINLCFIDYELK